MGAARQKLESELSIASDIQQAMLPLGTVIGRGRTLLDAQAVLEPAKAVGGDFYNFFERGDGELWFVIGDVSDKGVPAALFMARTRSEEHTSELQSLMRISYAVFCLKKKSDIT